MNFPHPDAIWLIPPILAIAFLLWVLFNFWKEERMPRRGTSAAQPHLEVTTEECTRLRSRAQSRGLYVTGRAMRRTIERAARS